MKRCRFCGKSIFLHRPYERGLYNHVTYNDYVACGKKAEPMRFVDYYNQLPKYEESKQAIRAIQ